MTTVSKRRILFFGDSITAGEGDEDALGWPGRLIAAENRRLAPAGIRLQGYPLGIGGNRLEDLAARMSSETHCRLTDRPGAIIVMIGVNDAVRASATTDRVPLDFDRLIERAHRLAELLATHRTGLWLAPAPVHPGLCRGDGATGDAVNENVTLLTSVFGTVAGRNRIPFLRLPLEADPIYMAALAANDGLHPTGAGYQRIADLLGAAPDWTEVCTASFALVGHHQTMVTAG